MTKDIALNNKREGQAMILAVLALGGTMLGATTIAGFLMLYQIRQATDFTNSAKSVFAADAGTEWALYSFFNPPAGALPVFSNGATTTVTCYDGGNVVTPCDSTSTAVYAISKGGAGNTARAFGLTFVGSEPNVSYP